MGTLEDIVRELPNLDKKQLEDLRSRITIFLQFGIGASVVSGPRELSNEEMALDLVIEVVGLMGMGYLKRTALMAQPQYKPFKEKVAAVSAFIEQQLPGGRKIEQRVLLRLGIQILARNIGHQGRSITHSAVMQQFHRIPAVLNKAFPGYAEMGYLGMVVKREMIDVREEPEDRAEHIPRRG